MKLRLLVLLTPLGLAACAVQPEYPVRPGEPRATFDVPHPAYPIAPPPPAAVQPAPPPPQTPPPQAPLGDEPPSYIHPEPAYVPAPDDSAAPVLRGRQSAGPALPVGAPPPALETPRSVVVRPGETLFEVAERVRTPIRAIIELNHLEPPYEVTPGTTLRIPPPVIYTVKTGDTLLSVARRFSIDPRSLANLNDITLETPLRAGQRLALPALVKDSAPPPPRPPTTVAGGPPVGAPSPVTAPLSPRPKPPMATASSTPPEPAAPEPPSAAVVAAAGKGRFAWPAKGDILSTFGPKGPGQRNDGLNIAVSSGEPVVAAAAGQVVYAGNSIPGFGNLVVVKHPDGWTSLYGNLGKISVKIRAQVAQGQPLGVAGLSGAVDRPQVHFEIRYAPTPQEKAQPVDPQTLLP